MFINNGDKSYLGNTTSNIFQTFFVEFIFAEKRKKTMCPLLRLDHNAI
jgi:hypothetical protein